MFIRIFLLFLLIFSTPAQARHHGPSKGYAFKDCPGEVTRLQGRGWEHYHWKGGSHRRGGRSRGCHPGGRRCGGHGWWDIPVQEARRLNPIEVSPQSLERGETLYRENCLRCHGNYGFGDGPQARGLRIPPANLHHAARHYSDGALFYIIRKGRDPMPAWEGVLSEDELWNLINFLRFQLGARHGHHFSYYPERYRTGGEPTDNPTDQLEAVKAEPRNHQAKDHDDMQRENSSLDQDDRHDEHHDE
jgi:hypothetical protein